MRLEEYWGVGPKTRALLTEQLGVEAAVRAIESADLRTLVDAGLSRGRATRILRHARGEDGLAILATRDARNVYKRLLDVASDYALTREAADRISLLTPLSDRAEMEARLDRVREARESRDRLDEVTREAVLAAFEEYDSVDGGDLASVRAAAAISSAGATAGVFAPLADLDDRTLADAADALAALEDGGVAAGADDRLDDLRDQLGALEDAAGNAADIVESVQAEVRGADGFREAFAREVVDRTGVDLAAVRNAMAPDAADATDFVTETLRALADDRRSAVETRAAEVRADLEATVEESRETIDAAVAAVDDIAFGLSLARFAANFDLVRPSFVDDREVLAVENARNLSLSAAGEAVQPVTYAVGDHGLPAVPQPPSGDRVAVLTGANSGGKTTLLETLCEVSLLAQMGLPVPADRAELSLVDAVVFHRRHASFNAGVLESTLRSVVPPVCDAGRTLMLVDEFEAITEPGSAADLLHGLVTLTVDRGALGVFVTHLADDLEPLPETARTDGIFAEGLDPDLELIVDYQPRFDTVGRSTPEFIVSRLVANATDREERAGFETLAEAVGQEAVQRTLADARWAGD
ncbi:DNA mismatch repair protein [Halobacteriales archaeon QS_1_68_17]|nr:MAG: DNA mismatch repair protein [Halobacteriales archaeon QS_1_68_17]